MYHVKICCCPLLGGVLAELSSRQVHVWICGENTKISWYSRSPPKIPIKYHVYLKKKWFITNRICHTAFLYDPVLSFLWKQCANSPLIRPIHFVSYQRMNYCFFFSVFLNRHANSMSMIDLKLHTETHPYFFKTNQHAQDSAWVYT